MGCILSVIQRKYVVVSCERQNLSGDNADKRWQPQDTGWSGGLKARCHALPPLHASPSLFTVEHRYRPAAKTPRPLPLYLKLQIVLTLVPTATEEE